jgi:hypothetical protein
MSRDLFQPGVLNKNISSQLPFGGILGVAHELSGGVRQNASIRDQASGHERQGHRGPSEPPIIRRLFIAIVGLLLCFLGCSYGLDYEGMFKRAAIVGGGIIAGFVGMALWWAIQFPATWEWPL